METGNRLIRHIILLLSQSLSLWAVLALATACQRSGGNSAFSKDNTVETAAVGSTTTTSTTTTSTTSTTNSALTFAITSFTDRVFPGNALAQSSTLSFDWNNVSYRDVVMNCFHLRRAKSMEILSQWRGYEIRYF